MKVLVSALEPSSNLHLREVLKHAPDIELIGIFDKRIDRGTPLYDITEMAIMGVVDALKKLRWFFKVADEMVALAAEADKVLLMDSSGFNLPLAKKLKERYPDKEITYYILPQVWASRPKRVEKLEKYCDNLLGILPFETAYYPSGKAQYVGHPLLDEITTVCKPEQNKDCIAFLPGSRKSEIERLMPIFLEVRKQLPQIRPLLVIPPHFTRNQIAKLYIGNRNFEIVRNTQEALERAEFAFICSGTATLEAALMGTPFTLAYIAKKFDFFIGTKILGIKQVGLANIILTHYNNTTLHKELL
ncbi:MAG: lipid-A-disaccharide synthase, partial [Sulfurovum sp.]|nr:lipid-A-disaccharide synthase [Sulfurovum sp.]